MQLSRGMQMNPGLILYISNFNALLCFSHNIYAVKDRYIPSV